MALGSVALGYADPDVTDAVVEAIHAGNVSALSHELEVTVAEQLCALVPFAEQVRFLKSGAEAVAAAIRIARTHTGRTRVLGCGYFGWLDWSSDAAGVPAGDVALGFTTSEERLRNRVAETYQRLLGRGQDQAGMEYWVAIFKQGLTTEDIVSGFVGSVEYYFKTNQDGNPARWARSAYLDVLFRPAAIEEFDYWLRFLA